MLKQQQKETWLGANSKLLQWSINDPSYKIFSLQRTFPKCSWCSRGGTHCETEWHLPCGRSYGTQLLSASSPHAECDRSISGAEQPTCACWLSVLPHSHRLHARQQNPCNWSFQHIQSFSPKIWAELLWCLPKRKKGLVRNASSTSFLNTSFTFTISILKGHFWQNTTFMIHLKRKDLSTIRQAGNSFNLKPKFYIQRQWSLSILCSLHSRSSINATTSALECIWQNTKWFLGCWC